MAFEARLFLVFRTASGIARLVSIWCLGFCPLVCLAFLNPNNTKRTPRPAPTHTLLNPCNNTKCISPTHTHTHTRFQRHTRGDDSGRCCTSKRRTSFSQLPVLPLEKQRHKNWSFPRYRTSENIGFRHKCPGGLSATPIQKSSKEQESFLGCWGKQCNC